MNVFDLSNFRQSLRVQRLRVDSQVGQLRAEALQKTGGEASGGISNLPLHPADLASRQFEEDVALSLVDNEEHLLADINAALDRIDHGTFGRCEECAAPIPVERLEAIPYARYCVGCARHLEGELV